MQSKKQSDQGKGVPMNTSTCNTHMQHTHTHMQHNLSADATVEEVRSARLRCNSAVNTRCCCVGRRNVRGEHRVVRLPRS